MLNKQKKIFVSYTIRDGKITKDFLMNLVNKTDSTTSVYIDLIHNDSKNKQERVIKELHESDLVLLIKTEGTYYSEWVNLELFYAKKFNIPIYEFEYEEVRNIKFKDMRLKSYSH